MPVEVICLIYILTPLLIIFLFKRYKIARQVGTVIIAYAIGVVLALFGLIPVGEGIEAESMKSIQSWIQNLTVPIAIPLMLFNCDFKLWTKSLPKTIAALIGGVISIIVAVISAFFIFRYSGINELDKIAAMMTSIYTGGTMNFYALGAALNVNPTTIALTYTFEMLVTFPLIMFLVAGGYRFFRKLLPFEDKSTTLENTELSEIETNGIENYGGMTNQKVFPRMMLGLLVSIVFLGFGAGLSILMLGKLNELVIILTITTLAIAASFFKKIRQLPKTFELGMFFILMFSVVVASQFDIYSINMSAVNIGLFVLYVMFVSVIIHIIFSRITKVPGDLFTVAHVGLLCSSPFIPPIVGAMKNKKVLISGIVIGLVGYAVGTYLGVLLYTFFKLFI
ncbi:MAG: DUF819 family protein [Bacteroidales bacterium]|jgi:uncharacterized membrane protein|nr:DUF819 family protein [Bacteroidales bacterium]MDD2687152.1 DUF819 family protein [Bacteroidales bacterium]MDD3330062.1 DUF819 family protein [Bacteroidales bacterium]MDD4044090.1 DUF819 family protein [Bacteroidales bacterium]MDD4581525.1 DUF819 family protein [Bacteroidales bacterium]